MNRKYVTYGPGFSGDHNDLGKAQAVIRRNKDGAVYVRLDLANDEIENLRARILELENRELRSRYIFEACKIWERANIHAPEDEVIEQLCQRLGYGAVMDAAARLWYRRDHIGAQTTGPCAAMVRDWWDGNDTKWNGSYFREWMARAREEQEKGEPHAS